MKAMTRLGEVAQDAAKLLFRFREICTPCGLDKTSPSPIPRTSVSANPAKRNSSCAEALNLLGAQLQLLQLVAGLVGRDVVIDPQTEIASARHVGEQTPMGKIYSAGVQVAHRSDAQSIQFTKTVAQTLPRFSQGKAGDFVVGKLPSRHALQPAGGNAGARISFRYGRQSDRQSGP